MNKYMKLAIQEAANGIHKGHGGPFGCVIVKNDKVIAKAHNCVLLKKDPTCHSETEAIRKACKKLNTYDLSGCTLYVTGEPCLMCLTACLWANIEKIYYGCSLEENDYIGFRDQKFDLLIGKRKKLNFLKQLDHDECFKLFKEYKNIKNKIIY